MFKSCTQPLILSYRYSVERFALSAQEVYVSYIDPLVRCEKTEIDVQIAYTLKEISQTDLYLIILSSKTYAFEDKMIKY